MKKIYLILSLFLYLTTSNAQTLTVTSDKNPAIVGEQIMLKFTVNAKAKEFKAPKFTGLRVLSGPNSSSSSSYSFVNGKSKSEITTTYSFYLSAIKEGTFIIPPASVIVNNKTITSEAVSIKVVKGNTQQQNNKKAKSDNLFITVNTSRKNMFIGEQTIVTYKLHTRLDLENTELSALPNLNGFWKKDLETSSRFKREVINGIPYNTAVIKKTVLTAQKSGKLVIDPIEVTCSIRITNKKNRRDPFANFFSSYNIKEEIISSKPLTINIKDLPESKSKGFLGAVGNMNISSKVDKKELKANDAITYTVKITGTGNIELIEPLKIDFPEDFEVYDPKTSDKIFEGGNKRSVKIFEYLLIPRYQGEYNIAAYNFVSFNPKTKKYITKKTSSHKISVLKSDNNEENYISYNQQKVTTNNNDINYIKTSTSLYQIHEKNKDLRLFYFLFSLPLLLILLIKIVFLLNKGNSISILERKHKLANKIASKRLKKANDFMKKENFEGFFEEIEKSLWGYFSDKFKVDIINLSKESIEKYFNKHNIDNNIKVRFIELINDCEFARYAPSSNKNQQMAKLLSEAKKIIINVESELK
ncbi:MAG: BatD family protein [Flavobacteriales bacterium]|nr:BatD family protein [Flavobacteriales bacterium]